MKTNNTEKHTNSYPNDSTNSNKAQAYDAVNNSKDATTKELNNKLNNSLNKNLKNAVDKLFNKTDKSKSITQSKNIIQNAIKSEPQTNQQNHIFINKNLIKHERKIHNKKDSTINIRRGIEIMLRTGVKKGNNNDLSVLKRVLDRLPSIKKHAYTAQIESDFSILPTEVFLSFNHKYKIITIKENDENLFYIYKDASDNLTKLYTNPYDLLYQAQQDTKIIDKNIIKIAQNLFN